MAWDGGAHAFILDAMVAPRLHRQGTGTRLVARAIEEARRAGCAWLHVNFEEHLRPFYLRGCGFTPSPPASSPCDGRSTPGGWFVI